MIVNDILYSDPNLSCVGDATTDALKTESRMQFDGRNHTTGPDEFMAPVSIVVTT